MVVRTSIIPVQPTLARVDAPHDLHLEAICIFAAIGFFLDKDTYWLDEIVLPPASLHTLDANGKLLDSKAWFNWHYTPQEITFNRALDEFTVLFEAIIKEQTQGKKVILPLSGGLDSRMQAAALKRIKADVFSYSYKFENGYNENNIAQQIAKVCGFDFKAFTIPKGYLWDRMDTLAELNGCYTDFTSPRQMGVYDDFSTMGDVFSLGHWGDVLFDSMNLPELSNTQQVDAIFKKLIKRGGLELANDLWETWDLDGCFEDYFKERLGILLEGIAFDDTNSKLRAFKSLYWAPRWTSINLSIFEAHHPVTLPYYDDRMCQFICTIPEVYLKDRQLQIAYIKAKAPELAKITWEDQRPFNLNNFQFNKSPFNLPYRIKNKLGRTIKEIFGKPYIQRNWELQFLGDANKEHLKHHLLDKGLERFVPKSLIQTYYDAFTNKDTLQTAHAINILLVLSQFNSINHNG